MAKTNSYLSFKIGTEYYAANVSNVTNIIEYCDITKVPEMPSYMLGVINLRGQVLPVIDSRIKFGIENTEITTNTCILVMDINIDNEVIYAGVLVDGVAEVLEIEDTDIKDAPEMGSTAKKHYITGVYHDDNKFIMLLDVSNFFVSDETNVITV